ncbi:MAG: hypothetical protein IT512_09340 [Rhodocyclaceae bacterium]|nr:hypothetical protein [Rhodocyclaceae bacterium]
MNKIKGCPIPGMTAKAKGTMLGALLVTLASTPPVREETLPVRFGSVHREEMAFVVCNFPGPDLQPVDVQPVKIDSKRSKVVALGPSQFPDD